jgi:ubiquinone/menaquinone biosynthesis C-methylase UbiE
MAEDVRNKWQESAPYWEKHRNIIRTMFAPITEALIQDSAIAPGFSVLDVGTGPGEPALTVAEFVGKTGNVCGIDPAPEMIAAARRASETQGVHNVRFEACPADNLPFASAVFDAMVSRFAIMFFPSPVTAVQEIFRVLKPAAHAAFAVWSREDNNPFHRVFSRVMQRYVESPPPAEEADAFRFAPSGKLRAILDQAGAVDITERLFQFRIEAPLSIDAYWDLRSEMSEKFRSKLAMLSPEKRQEVRNQVVDGLRVYSNEKGMSFPAEVLIVSGKKR